MNRKELLTTYRAKVIELEELQHQLDRVGTDGRPSGCRTAQTGQIVRGTNDPASAAMHLADGLEAFAKRKEEELQQLAAPIARLLQEIPDFRTYLVIQRYYVLAETDEQVARRLSITRVRANQLRRNYLKQVS